MNTFFQRVAPALLLALLAASAGARTLNLGGSDPVGSLIDKQNEMFTKEVNEKGASIGLKVNFIRGEALGSDSAVIEQMMANAVQVYGDELGWYANWVNDFAILTWGFTFDNKAHVQAFLDSPMFEQAKARLRGKKIQVLAAAPLEPRVMFAKKKISTVADLAGLKMRVPGIKPFLLLWDKLGTHPTQVPWAETYLAVRTGVVDATDGSVSSGAAARFQEVTQYLVRTDHLISVAQISMNSDVYDALNPQERKVVMEAAARAVKWAATQAEAATQKVIGDLKAAGMQEIIVDKSSFAEKARAGVPEMESSGAWPAGLWQQVRGLKR